jgi:hypothetical protein
MRHCWTRVVRKALDSPLEQLLRGGIPTRVARRILREFHEHRSDLIAEQRDFGAAESAAIETADARLGSQQELVANLLRRPELRSWVRRRPCIGFVVAPALYFGASFCVSLLVFVGLVQWHKTRGDALTRASSLIRWISDYAPAYLLWGLPLAAALMLAIFAVRRRETSIWPCIGMLLMSCIGALTTFSFSLPPMAQAPSMGAGIGISTDHLGAVLIRTVSSAVPALAVFLWARRAQWREA